MSDIRVLAYLKDFVCIADQCEDTCCQHWHVRISKNNYKLLDKNTKKTPAEHKKFHNSIEINKTESASDNKYAFIKMDENGFCSYLTENRQCSIQSKYGVDILSDICTFFPRFFTQVNEDVELTGALSCPEVVRKCIRADISKHKFEKTGSDILPRGGNIPVRHEFDTIDIANPYNYYFTEVREMLLDVAKSPTETLQERLYILASYSHSISNIYFEGCEAVDLEVVKNFYIHVRDNSYISSVRNFLYQYENEQSLSMIVVYSILSLKMQQAPQEKFTHMINEIFNMYINLLAKNGVAQTNDANNFYIVYQDLLENIASSVSTQIDNTLTKYLINCLYREWFVKLPTPFIYIQMLLVRIAVLRFVIVSRIPKGVTNQAEVERIIVDSMYQFARAVDHNLAFLQIVYEALSEQQMMNFDYSAPLIKI